MPKRKKKNATQPPPTKRRSRCSTAAASRSVVETSSTPTVTSPNETPAVPPASDAQSLLLQSEQLISQLSNVIQLLTTSLSGNTLTNHHQPQVPTPNDESAERLSEASDNPPLPPIATTNTPPSPSIGATNNQHTSTIENFFTAANGPQLTTT